MTKVLAIPVGGEFDFIAYVYRGDAEVPERVWVCVRSQSAPPNRSWLGCWSKVVSDRTGHQVKEVLRDLADKVQATAVAGPMGPWLGDVYFFPGWDSWGPGIPGPLRGIDIAELVALATEVLDVESVDL